jgi:hypothetical protein
MLSMHGPTAVTPFFCRREELAVGLTSHSAAQALLDKYPREAVEVAMLKYVNEGRQAMGPSALKVRSTESHPPASLYWNVGGCADMSFTHESARQIQDVRQRL